MSASLIILIPVILLGIVGLFCFVGCVLPEYGLGPSYTAYTGKTVLPTSTIIAYWPLKEGKDTDEAIDLISGSNGKYIDPNTVEVDTIYPWPQYSIPNGANPDVLSAAAPGDIKLGQPGIVVGDVDLLPNDPVAPACMVVNGGYVDVPWKDKFIPKSSFTLEAWVRVDWTVSDPNAFRFVVDSREISPATTGFGLCAKAVDDQPGVYAWRGIVGDGSAAFVVLDSIEAPFTLKDPASAAGTTHYLALTYDGPSQTLTLFVNGAQNAQSTSVSYAPNMTQPLWIGAGAPYVPRRPQPADVIPASPLFPFVGAIQDVAIYSVALDATAILKHFNNGNGTDPQ
jgi:hypothetical protein